MVTRRSQWLSILTVMIAGVLALGSAQAAVTGKIAGKVIDRNTKEPLIGVPVVVVGTSFGALTDTEGRFVILSVPAGEHVVKASLIGYTSVVTSNIRVRPDLTSTLDIELEQSTIELPAIQVVREREMIQMDEASTKRDITAAQISSLPVTSVADILKTQVGVKIRNDQFHIRGGRAEELLYTVDGVSMKDPLGGRGPTESLNLSGTEIENIAVIKGGWSAEYGEATSGIINVATKQGDRQETRGHFEYFTDNLATRSLNTYSFNYNRAEFTLGGPEPLLSKKLLPALGLGGPSDKLTYFINADFDRTGTYTPIDNYTTPTTRMDFRATKFLGMRILDRQENYGNLGAKLTYRVCPTIRMTGIFKRSYERRILWDWRYRYTPNTMPWIEDRNDRYSLTWTHNLSPSTFYQVIVSQFERRYEQLPGDPATPGGRINPDRILIAARDADHYADANNNGVYDPPEDFVDVYTDGAYNEGDIWTDVDNDGRFTDGIDALVYDFNGNGRYDASGGEPFADRNGNLRWDQGDPLEQDGNGNGVYDPDRERDMFGPSSNDLPEPYIDGDRSVGEPYTDINKNGRWDAYYRWPLGGTGEPFTDLSGDSKYQGPEDPWVPGVPYDDLNGNATYDRGTANPSGSYSTSDANYNLGEPFVDLNGNGLRDPADGFFDRGWDADVIWHKREVRTFSVDADVTSQIRPEHELKAGLKFSAHNLSFAELQKPYVLYQGIPDNSPYPDRGELRDFYTQTPKAGAVYVRDKMEYGQLIANLGFRYDYFVQSKNANVDVSQSGLADQFGNRTVTGNYRDKFAPRIAFSYPISDKAKVFFNYGHFYQMPQLTYMYRRSTQTNSQNGIVGNVNLDFQKTVQYEFGIQYLLSPEYVLSIQGFYKDDFGRIGPSDIAGQGFQDVLNFYENRDYARSRGLELELEKRYGNYVSGVATYDYSYSYGKASAGSLDFFENFYNRSSAVVVQEFPMDWDERHSVTLILDIRVPSGDHPRLFGFTLPDDFGLNVFWQFGSGYPYTPGSRHPGAAFLPGGIVMQNSERFPATSNVDVRFNKDFRLGRTHYTFEIWVNNIFDTRNVQNVDTQTGRPETTLNWDNIVYLGRSAPDPRNWEAGRQIRLGLGVNF